jgi:hypothetical protein
VYDSASLDALMRAARRARGWRSWLRLVSPDAGVRRLVRLVALDEVMPVYASVTAAVEAATFEAAAAGAGGDLAGRRDGGRPASRLSTTVMLFSLTPSQ